MSSAKAAAYRLLADAFRALADAEEESADAIAADGFVDRRTCAQLGIGPEEFATAAKNGSFPTFAVKRETPRRASHRRDQLGALQLRRSAPSRAGGTRTWHRGAEAGDDQGGCAARQLQHHEADDEAEEERMKRSEAAASGMNGVNGRTSFSAVDTWAMPDALREHATCAVDLLADAQRKPDFLIDRLAEAGDVMLITGKEKDSFKTWMALDLGIARTLGASWLGFDVARGRPLRALFISTETRARPLTRRAMQLCAGRGADVARVAKQLVIIDEPITMVSAAERERVRTKKYNETKLAAIKVPKGETERKQKLAANAERIADLEVAALGHNVELLDAISRPGLWSIIIIDTLRQCLAGDENSSQDAAAFNAAVRELARACGCVVVVVHHTNKSGDATDARASRGSGEITAGPDVLMTIDTSGEYPTCHFRLRNHEPVDPIGYRLAAHGEGVRLDVLAPCAGNTKGMSEDEVMTVFKEHPEDGLSISTVRKLVAKARGQGTGAKANARAVQKHLDALVARGAISKCEIETKGCADPMPGYRLGDRGGRVRGRTIESTHKTIDEFLDVGGAADV